MSLHLCIRNAFSFNLLYNCCQHSKRLVLVKAQEKTDIFYKQKTLLYLVTLESFRIKVQNQTPLP